MDMRAACQQEIEENRNFFAVCEGIGTERGTGLSPLCQLPRCTVMWYTGTTRNLR